MKVLLLSPELFRAEGGIARIMRLYLKALGGIAGPGGRVDSLVLNDAPGDDPRLARYTDAQFGGQIGCAGRKGTFVRATLRRARRADILVCGHLHQLPVAWLAKAFNPRLKYYLVAHGIEVWRPYGWLERRALRGADRVLCVSEFTRRQLLRFFPALPAEKLTVVPNALDPFFAPAADNPAPSAHFETPRLLTVSRLTAADSYKGIDTLIEALPLIRRDHPFARLRVVGRGDDLVRLQGLAASFGVTGAVDFLGAIDDDALLAEYGACDIFALPSRREGFGLVYLEAMTRGKPCIGARAGGVPEVIHDAVGQLVEYGNIPNLAAAVADLVRHPRDSEVVRRHAGTFAYDVFARRLAAALS